MSRAREQTPPIEQYTILGAQTATSLFSAERPDPRTVLLALAIINFLSVSRLGITVVMLSTGVTLVALALIRAWKAALGVLIMQSLWVFFILGLPRLWANGFTAFLATTSFWFLQLTGAGAIALYAIRRIQPGELVAGLRQLRFPRAIVTPLTVLLRFIPIVISEYRDISEAMSLRGLSMGWQAWAHPLRYLEFVMVPLLMSCSRLADEMTAAAMVRGLGSPRRPTTVRHLQVRPIDVAWWLVLAALVGGAIGLKHYGLNLENVLR